MADQNSEMQALFAQNVTQTPEGKYFLPFKNTVGGQAQPGYSTILNENGFPVVSDTPLYGGGYNEATQNYEPGYSNYTDYFNAYDPNSVAIRGSGYVISPQTGNALTRGTYGPDLGYYIDPTQFVGGQPANVGAKPNENGTWQILSLMGAPLLSSLYFGGVGAGMGAGASDAAAGTGAFSDTASTGAGSQFSSTTGNAGAGAGGGAASGAADVGQGLQLSSAGGSGIYSGGEYVGSGLQAGGSTGGGLYGASGEYLGSGLQLSPAASSALGTGATGANAGSSFGSYYQGQDQQGGAALATQPQGGAAAPADTGGGLKLSSGTQGALGTNTSTGGGFAPTGGGASNTASGTSFVDSVINQLKANAVPLSIAALAAGSGSQRREMPNQGQIQQGGQAASQVGTQYLEQARLGQLMPWQQSGLDQFTQQAKNQINQYFASIGQFDSTARMQALSQVDQQAQVLKGQLLQQTLNSGLQAIGVAQGPLTSVANYQLAQDRQLQDAMGNFARSVGTLYGAQAGRPQQQGAAAAPATGGAAPNTPAPANQPYITNETDALVPRAA